MELRNLIWKVLLENIDQNILNLKNKYVGEGKPISEEDFNKLIEVTNNKFYLLSWLTKKVGQGIIKPEDIYKYKEYFEIFEKNKNKFQHKDIHLYKTPEDVKNFLSQVISIREADVVFDEIEGKDNYVPQNEIEKLEATEGIKYLGMYDDGKFKYQVFQIFGVNQNTWKTYRDILGKCKGRNKGAKIDICTIANYNYFKDYLKQDKGSSYFLLYNLDDPKSPYQLHYESGQFMDKNDDNAKINQLKFFEFVGNKVPQYSSEREDIPSEFELPVKGKGGLNEKGKKEGLWRKNYKSGKIESLSTYKNGNLTGPFVNFYENGTIGNKGVWIRGALNGEYESYYKNGQLDEKGTYENGRKIGVWRLGLEYSGGHLMVDYDVFQTSGFTKSGVLKYVAGFRGTDDLRPYGVARRFYPSGKIKGVGKLGVAVTPLGVWEWYTSTGKLKSKGKYLRADRTGEWTDLVKTKNGESFYFVAQFENGEIAKNTTIKVLDSNGQFLKKIKKSNINPYPYWEYFRNLWGD